MILEVKESSAEVRDDCGHSSSREPGEEVLLNGYAGEESVHLALNGRDRAGSSAMADRIELTLEEFSLIYEAIRKPTTMFEPGDVVDIVRAERKARLLLEQIRYRAGLREAAPGDDEFQTR